MSREQDDRAFGPCEQGDEPVPGWAEGLRRTYHPPPEPPREEIWAAIAARLEEAPGTREDDRSGDGSAGADGPVVDLDEVRRRRRGGSGVVRGPLAWAVAAAAVLVVGIGIGRWSAPGAVSVPGPAAPTATAPTPSTAGSPSLELAARRHLGQTESLLATVRADALTGRMDPSVGPWARSLLLETRLLMDARTGEQDEVQRLLSDLELVLVQIVGAAEGDGFDEERLRTELDLAVRSLEEREMLTRIRSAASADSRGA